MSADNWAVCPKCHAEARAKRAAAAELASTAYGVKPVEEFDRLRAIASAPLDTEKLRTLREDYDIGVYGDDEEATQASLVISYEGSCKTCGFHVAHHYSGRVFPVAEADLEEAG